MDNIICQKKLARILQCLNDKFILRDKAINVKINFILGIHNNKHDLNPCMSKCESSCESGDSICGEYMGSIPITIEGFDYRIVFCAAKKVSNSLS